MRDGFARIDARFTQVDGRSNQLEGRIDALALKVEDRFDRLEGELRGFYGTQRHHDTRLNAIQRSQAGGK